MKSKEPRSSELMEKLNKLLAAYQVVYFNTRTSHWLIKGENFFELHKVFENGYNDAAIKIDAIAERILTLGGTPLLSATDMLKASPVKESGGNGDQSACVSALIKDLIELSVIENEIVELADEEKDIVTADLITGYLGEQQKTTWMLSQFLSKRSSITK
ncbi:MAG TPA: DNA starvation/stationary phase protection protein [Bacteroidia bacterium]